MSPAPELKATLTLPQTAFPMKANLPQNEPRRLARWASMRLYDELRMAGAGRPAYILHDGPPYANGPIHLGHALNKGLKDFVVKSKTMAGFDSPYVPGYDCHGLPIEIKVDEQLGRRKLEMPAPAVLDACRAYAQTYVDLQTSQFERIGCFGRWDTALQDHGAGLRGADPGGVLRIPRKGLRLPRAEAGLLVHSRPYGPGRGRGRVRDAHQPVGLRALQDDVGSRGAGCGACGARSVHHHLDDDPLDAAGVDGGGIPSGFRLRGAGDGGRGRRLRAGLYRGGGAGRRGHGRLPAGGDKGTGALQGRAPGADHVPASVPGPQHSGGAGHLCHGRHGHRRRSHCTLAWRGRLLHRTEIRPRCDHAGGRRGSHACRSCGMAAGFASAV